MAPTLISNWNNHLQKEKWWHVCHKSKENRGEFCCLYHVGDANLLSSRNTSQRVVLKFAATTGATPISLAALLLKPSVTRSRQASQRHRCGASRFRAVSSLSQMRLNMNPPPLLCVTHSPLNHGDVAIIAGTTQETTSKSAVVDAGCKKFCACAASSLTWDQHDLCFCCGAEEAEKKSSHYWKVWDQRGILGEWSAPAPKCTAAPPVTWRRSSLPEDGALAQLWRSGLQSPPRCSHWMGRNNHRVVLSCSLTDSNTKLK